LSKAIRIEENVPMAPLTTLQIGGPARFFVRAESNEQVVDAFDLVAKRGMDVFVLGGGSNLLVADSGFDGLVIQVAISGVERDGETLHAGAGEGWDQIVALCVENELAGVECLSGIPGFVGGTPIQNVGAYGQEVSETIVSVRCFDRLANQIVELTNADCGFTYRTSIFNSVERDRYVVLSVTYRLKQGRPAYDRVQGPADLLW
jgi:UDP-N-acetylmuramate dehydrogenase